MQVKTVGKYELKELHQEIGLMDRKIAYCRTYEKFDSEEERAAAVRRLETKRLTLVKKAKDAVSRGIECDPKYVPRSLSETTTAAKAGA